MNSKHTKNCNKTSISSSKMAGCDSKKLPWPISGYVPRYLSKIFKCAWNKANFGIKHNMSIVYGDRLLVGVIYQKKIKKYHIYLPENIV